jgi:DeoR/GlpR family transcriptional regulator of sugar metabolism
LDAVGACSYQDLSRLLGVSEMTVRRDVDKLVADCRLLKTLGGVQSARGPEQFYESAVRQRLSEHRAEKEQIAAEAVRQILPGQTIFLDGSTTSLVLARQLARKVRGITIVTHSALICLESGGAADNTILSLGGQFDSSTACFVGPAAEEGVRRFFVDAAYLSTKGFLSDQGTFESAIDTFRIKQLMVEQAARTVLMVDHSKFGQRALCQVLAVEQLDEVITDAGTAADDVANLERRGVTVRIAPPGELAEVHTHAQ